MLSTPVEQNIVRKNDTADVSMRISFRTTSLIFLEIVLDDRVVANIEIAEDALGDEVYYHFWKTTRKSLEETELDEERV